MLRTRLVQHVELLNMVLQLLDYAAARRVQIFAEELCVGDECVHRLRALAKGSLHLAAHDFDRDRYLNRLEIDGRLDGLRPPSSDPDATHRAWTTPVVGDDVPAGWRSLGQLPSNTIGRHVHDFYVLRGFTFPARRAPRYPCSRARLGARRRRLRHRRGRDRSIRLHCPRQRRPRRLLPAPR